MGKKGSVHFFFHALPASASAEPPRGRARTPRTMGTEEELDALELAAESFLESVRDF
jgi:hypothetical protein